MAFDAQLSSHRNSRSSSHFELLAHSEIFPILSTHTHRFVNKVIICTHLYTFVHTCTHCIFGDVPRPAGLVNLVYSKAIDGPVFGVSPMNCRRSRLPIVVPDYSPPGRTNRVINSPEVHFRTQMKSSFSDCHPPGRHPMLSPSHSLCSSRL